MFESLLQTLRVLKPYLGDSLLLFTLAIGVMASLVVFSILFVASWTANPTRRRLLESHDAQSIERNDVARRIDRSVGPLKALFLPGKESEIGHTRKRLMHAGYLGNEVVTVFYFIKTLSIIIFSVGAGLFAYLVVQIDSKTIMYAMLGGALVGMILPSYLLDRRIEKRQTEIINAFPDILDLLVACTEAGLGLNAAIQRVARETAMMYPALSAEFNQVNSEIRSGADRIDALRGMSIRTGVEDISGFVSMVSQSIKFGTSVADTLRIYAEEFRDKRMQRAEEKAAKVSTKLIFPLVVCIFPAFFAVAIGPAVLAIIRAFGSFE